MSGQYYEHREGAVTKGLNLPARETVPNCTCLVSHGVERCCRKLVHSNDLQSIQEGLGLINFSADQYFLPLFNPNEKK